MTRHSASRGIIYSAPPTGDDERETAETAADTDPVAADD